jgi:hypothetical protein
MFVFEFLRLFCNFPRELSRCSVSLRGDEVLDFLTESIALGLTLVSFLSTLLSLRSGSTFLTSGLCFGL